MEEKNIAFIDKAEFKKIIWEKALRKESLSVFIDQQSRRWKCDKCGKWNYTKYTKKKNNEIICYKCSKKIINTKIWGSFPKIKSDEDSKYKIYNYLTNNGEFSIKSIHLFSKDEEQKNFEKKKMKKKILIGYKKEKN